MALMLRALLVPGLHPGPQLIGEHPEIVWGLLASFWIGNLTLVCVGVYSVNNNAFDLLAVFVFTTIGFAMSRQTRVTARR